MKKHGLKTALSLSVLMTASVYAADSNLTGIGAMAARITDSMNAVAQLIGSAAYVAGLAFFMGALLKFKQHRDNPTQVPIGTPFTYFGIAVCLVFLPNLLTSTGETVFSDPKAKGAGGSGFGSLGVSE